MNKKSLPNSQVRKAYYSLVDGLGALERALEDTSELAQDVKLNKSVSELREKEKELRKLLDDSYLWD
jgi:cell fate (sporulation/competence/biofilm development) regulator YlbF (YheA/YmcA/DUF963 family)